MLGVGFADGSGITRSATVYVEGYVAREPCGSDQLSQGEGDAARHLGRRQDCGRRRRRATVDTNPHDRAHSRIPGMMSGMSSQSM